MKLDDFGITVKCTRHNRHVSMQPAEGFEGDTSALFRRPDGTFVINTYFFYCPDWSDEMGEYEDEIAFWEWEVKLTDEGSVNQPHAGRLEEEA